MLLSFFQGASRYVIPLLLLLIPLYGLLKGVPVYEVFARGAGEGLKTAGKVLPFMLAMLFVIGILRESGAMDLITALLSPITNALSVPGEVLPLGLMRSLSGSGAQALLSDILSAHGPDSLIGRTASVVMGSTETTLYCVSLYYGYVGVKNSRYTIPVGLMSDAMSLILASLFSRILY